MRHWGVLCVMAIGLGSLIGCGWQAGKASAPKGGLAVVDLDEIATSVGANTRLADMVKMREVSLNQAFGKMQTELSDGIKELVDDVKSRFEDEVPTEEARKLQKETITANAKLQQFRSQAQLDLNTYTEQLKQQFRAEVRPIAHEVAAKKGFSVVIPKNDALLLSVEPGNDITNDVILALQARNQKSAAETRPATETKPVAATETAAKPSKKKTADKSKPKDTDEK